MNTRILLGSSALVMGLAGFAATFLPHELLDALGVAPDPILPVVFQLLGAGWFAFAMMNWTARGNAMGGIYGRPLALGNLTHFLMGALALTKAAANGTTGARLLPLAVIYVVFAVAFAVVFFRNPIPVARPAGPSSR